MVVLLQIIPSLRNWEEVLFLTDVPSWTPHAVFQATRLFVSSLNAKLVRMAGATRKVGQILAAELLELHAPWIGG
jgi:Bystin